MADTQSKIEKRREEARKRQQKIRKWENSKIKHSTVKNIRITCVVVLVLILLAALILPSMGITKRLVTAVTIGDTSISTAEYSYYYRSSFQNYYNSMASYVGEENVPINLSRSLEKQDMSEDKTYADYFSDNAVSQLTELVIWATEAEKAGFEMPEEAVESVETIVSQLETAANNSNMRLNNYISSNYGTGFNLNLFRQCVERELLAQAYKTAKLESFSYTNEQLEDYFNENENQFSTVDFRIETFGQAAATEETEEITAEQAKDMADAFIAAVTDEQSFADAAMERSKESLEEGETATDDSLSKDVSYSSVAQLDSNVADWAFGDDVKVGDKTVIASKDGTIFYAVYMLRTKERNETKTVDVRHILVSVSDMEDEEAKAEGKQKAEDLLAQWKDEGGTEEGFAELAKVNSGDSGSASNGGLYEGIQPGEMVVNFNDWCFDASRKPGDTGIVETNYGYHVMYYVQQNEQATWQAKVEDTMRQNDYNAFYETAKENYEVKTHWLGLYLRNEPI